MKKLILSAASICLAGIAMGQQWNTVGNNIYSANSGYVGIQDRLFLQRTPYAAGNNYNRGTIGDDIYWDNTAGSWHVGISTDSYSDFSMIRFANNGVMNFYTGVSTGANYTLSDASLDGSYKRMSLSGSGITINGTLGFTPSSSIIRSINGNSEIGLALYSNADINSGSGIIAYSNNGTGATGRIDMVAGSGNGSDPTTTPAFNFMYYAGNQVYSSYMNIFRDGKISIGNISSRPGSYKLYVEQGILTEKVRVAIQNTGSWADYVFADNYELKPLHEVESFINENKHLPDVPSADEVVKDGIDVAAMNAKLLQKVEELTLYMIQQQKQMEQQQREIEALKKHKK